MATSPNSGFSSLHYGGSMSPAGRFGRKPAKGNTFRSLKRFEDIARLENAGFGHGAIAAMLCISPNRLTHIKNSADYSIARLKITHGIILEQDKTLAMIKEQRREMLTQLLPPAHQILANELQRPATTLQERKHQTALSLELMDREGTFAKVSRTEVKPVDSFDFETKDAESRSIIQAIRAVAAPASSSMHSKLAQDANAEFSNSHTLSAVDQQKALDTLEQVVLSSAEGAELLELIPTDGTVN